jgi:hypothetical protein
MFFDQISPLAKVTQDKGMSDGLISQLRLAWWGMQMIGGNI